MTTTWSGGSRCCPLHRRAIDAASGVAGRGARGQAPNHNQTRADGIAANKSIRLKGRSKSKRAAGFDLERPFSAPTKPMTDQLELGRIDSTKHVFC
jgi:hypothetical protein